MVNSKDLLVLVALIFMSQSTWAYREITSLLDNTKELNNEEINALRPLFEELQLQYDHIISKTPQDNNKLNEQFQNMYEATLKEFHQQFADLFQEEATTVYDTNLPTVEEILGTPDFSLMTKEQQLEFLDMQSILQDTLDDAQSDINELVAKALLLETNLIKLNKSKIVMFVLKALGLVFNAATRVSRAAYCTYSHIPQLNTSLHSLYEGVDCYLYTTALVVKIQNEIYQTVMTVRKNIFELAAVYQKVANKNSVMGKIVSLMLNFTKIAKSILGSLRTTRDILKSIQYQLPSAALEVANCSKNFTVQIPFMIKSVANVTECILFVDDTTNDYDFMQPEDATRKPEVIESEEESNEDCSEEGV